MNWKNIRDTITSKLTLKNLDSCLKSIDSGITTFSKGVDSFSKSMQSFNDEFSDDIRKSDKRRKSESRKNKQNIDKLFGKNNTKIWSD